MCSEETRTIFDSLRTSSGQTQIHKCKANVKQNLTQCLSLHQDGRHLQNIANMRGVPLVASSPMRHDSPVQHPLEVQSYQPPWKAFADYALQSDIDPHGPHFQHLVSQVSVRLESRLSSLRSLNAV